MDMKAWREGMAWTQAEAAAALDVSLSTIQGIEAGRRESSRLIELSCEMLALKHKSAPAAEQPERASGAVEFRERVLAIIDEVAAEQLVPASVEARLNAIEQRLLPEAVRAVVLRWHATWLAQQPPPAGAIRKATKMQQADMTEEEEELDALKARARASFPSEDEIQRQIRQTMRERQEAQAREKAEKHHAEELAMIARRAARSVTGGD